VTRTEETKPIKRSLYGRALTPKPMRKKEAVEAAAYLRAKGYDVQPRRTPEALDRPRKKPLRYHPWELVLPSSVVGGASRSAYSKDDALILCGMGGVRRIEGYRRPNRSGEAPLPEAHPEASGNSRIGIAEPKGDLMAKKKATLEEAASASQPDLKDAYEELAAARARLEEARRLEEAADDRAMGTPLDHPDLDKNRRLSIKAGHTTAQAEQDVLDAEKTVRLFGGSP